MKNYKVTHRQSGAHWYVEGEKLFHYGGAKGIVNGVNYVLYLPASMANAFTIEEHT